MTMRGVNSLDPKLNAVIIAALWKEPFRFRGNLRGGCMRHQPCGRRRV